MVGFSVCGVVSRWSRLDVPSVGERRHGEGTWLHEGNRRMAPVRELTRRKKLTPVAAIPPNCPIRDVVQRVGDKWSLLVLFVLFAQARRFGELRRAIPDVSQRMLTKTLRSLQREGLLSREVFPTNPPSVEYR